MVDPVAHQGGNHFGLLLLDRGVGRPSQNAMHHSRIQVGKQLGDDLFIDDLGRLVLTQQVSELVKDDVLSVQLARLRLIEHVVHIWQ
jgi:hypothetical protein